VEGRPVKRLTQAEQEERRRFGLCYNCDEKFGRGHNRVCKRLYLLDCAIDDEADTPALIEEDITADAAPHVSLHAVAGLRRNDTMQIHLTVCGVPLVALLDSGLTHNFISEEAAKRTDLPLQLRPGMTATVANGERISCVGAIRRAAFSVDDELFNSDLFVLPFAGSDIVLGTQWLATLGPILWDFSAQKMSFWRRERQIFWRSVAGPEVPGLLATSSSATLMEALLDFFAAVFAEPATTTSSSYRARSRSPSAPTGTR